MNLDFVPRNASAPFGGRTGHLHTQLKHATLLKTPFAAILTSLAGRRCLSAAAPRATAAQPTTTTTRARKTTTDTNSITSASKSSSKTTSSSNTSKAASTSTTTLWPCKAGQLVRIVQTMPSGDGNGGEPHTVQIIVEGVTAENPEVVWGVYRSSPSIWQHPDAISPPGSHMDDNLGAMRSPMQRSDDAPSTTWTAAFQVPPHLAPLTLAFLIATDSPRADSGVRKSQKPKLIKPLTGRHFSALIGLQAGRPSPSGPSLLPSSQPQTTKIKSSQMSSAPIVNFAVCCRGATGVALVLLKPPKEQSPSASWTCVEIALDPQINKTGDQWHVAIPGLRGLDKLCYGWRIDGNVSWESGYRIQPDAVLLDPYAPAITHINADNGPPVLLPELYTGKTSSGGKVLAASALGSVAAAAAGAGATGVASNEEAGVSSPLMMPLESLRVLELDPRSFAQGSEVNHPGTFLGVVDRIDHIRAVGANAVVLGPCYATSLVDFNEGSKHRGAATYMAPDPSLSTNPASPTAAAREMRDMVAALHAAGIEVIVSIDPTFTADGTDTSSPSAVSLRGLDHTAYYRPNGVLNCGSPATQELLTASLRRWAREFGVDGFCFLSAENMTQDADGQIVDAPALVEALCMDPVLSGLKLIAAPFEDALLPRGGAQGFPHWGLWQQRNEFFSRDMMSFIAEGTSGMLDAVAMRLTGSADIFGHRVEDGLPGNIGAPRRPSFAFNAISKFPSSTSTTTGLKEISAEAAGVAGAAAVAINGLGTPLPSATTIAKSLLVATLLSQGVPVITQHDVEDVELARFVGVVSRLRRRLATLLLPPLFDSPRDITWRGAHGGEPDWEGTSYASSGDPGSNYLSFVVKGTDGSAVLIGFNPHPLQASVMLPPPPAGADAWYRAVDTSLMPPQDAALTSDEFGMLGAGEYLLSGKAALVLVAGPAVEQVQNN